MADSKMLEIAERLLERSEKGEVSWQDTVDDNEFIVALPEYSIVIERVRPLLRMLAASPPYRLSLANERGTRLESLELNPIDHGYHRLKQIYELARHKALRVNQRLEEALEVLGSEGPIGAEPDYKVPPS